jgi:EmrB/QacA subfamily drug resistance transporter
MTTATVPATGSPPPAAGERARWVALTILCVGALMIVLDMTIVNVALPAIQRSLHFSQSNLAWVVNAYLITFGGLLLLAGRVGDLVGARTVFLTGLAVFVSASILCGIGASATMLVAARFAQGVGAAMSSAVILGLIVTMFPEPAERAKAIGVFSFVASAGASIGLLAGGVITQVLDWHWIFFVNVPIGAITALLAVRFVPRDRGAGRDAGADITGAVLITAALTLGIYAIIRTQDYGWLSAHTLGVGGAALVLLAGFLAWERRCAAPLVPLRVFRSRTMSGANLIQMLFAAGMFGMFFLGSLYMQRVAGYSALQIGLAFFPAAILIAAVSLAVAPRLILRAGSRATLLPGIVLAAVGLAWLARVPVHAAYAADLLPAIVLVGLGAGLGFPAIVTLAMSAADPREAGLASGIVNTTQQVGGAVGLAVLATLASTHTSRMLAAGYGRPAALTSGYRLGWEIGVGLLVMAFVLAATVLRSPVGMPAAETARASEAAPAEAA